MKNKVFEKLKNIVYEVNEATDLISALNIIVQRTKEVMGVDVVSIYFRDHITNQLVLMATEGLNKNAIGKIKLKQNQGLIGMVVNQAEAVNIEDAHAHPNYHFVTETDEISFHGFLGVPIIQHRRVLGVLVVRQARKRRFSVNEEAFLVTLAAQLAGGISYAEKMGELKLLLNNKEDHSLNMQGLSGSPGIAIGEAVVVFPPANIDVVPDKHITGTEIDEQINAFKYAVSNVDIEFKELSKKMEGLISSEELALFDVFSLMLQSESLIQTIINRITAGQWAQGALRETINEHVKQFDAMQDEYLRERAVDIKDLGRRILTHLQSNNSHIQDVTGPVILVGEEVSVSQFSEVPMEHLAGIISTKGSASSHVAILSKALNIPSVMGIDNLPVNHVTGQKIIVDGYRGQIYIKPSKAILDEYSRLIEEDNSLNDELNGYINMPSETLDGVHIPLYVNTGLLEDISPSLKSGAEGVGLYRTEIPFLIRDGFPSEDEQAVIYKQVLKKFSPRPVTFRTLDIGGDKGLPYFPVVEENPFLGWRGIRIMLDHPEIFLTQIRAILKVNNYDNNLRLMLPMICDVSEVDEALVLIRQAHQELCSEGITVDFPLIGIMIEVPSAVYQMDALAKRVDFFSVGSNDLTQYLLAVDRNNKQVAGLFDSMHPSVLSAINHVVKIAQKYSKPVSVCGEMAGDPVAALALVGMGIDSLSMSTSSLLKVKKTIRSFSQKQAEELIEVALSMESALSIRKLFNDALDKAGLKKVMKGFN